MDRTFNVVMSCAGRRVSLLNLWKKAIDELGLTGQVIATDSSPLAAAWQQADVRCLLPRCDTQEYGDALLKVCRQHNVNLVVPTIDTELPLLATLGHELEAVGTVVLVSSPECIRIAGDKVLTNQWLRTNGFPTVAQTSPAAAIEDRRSWPLPLIAKPRSGSSSIGVFRVSDQQRLESLACCPDYVVEGVAPGQEHTVDVLVDKNGKAACTVPRRRIEVRAGEVSKSVTVRCKSMQSLAAEICERLPGAYGPMNVQLFKAPDGRLKVVEINARFGGGFPLAARAGADFPRWIIEELIGFPSAEPKDAWHSGLGMLRYDSEVFLDLGSQL